MDYRVKRKIILWIVLPIVAASIILLVISSLMHRETEKPGWMTEEEHSIFVGFYDAVLTGIAIGFLVFYPIIIGLYIWYEERKKKDE